MAENNYPSSSGDMTSRKSKRRDGGHCCVRFANRTKVYLIPTFSEYTEAEFEATWMVDEDSKASQAGLVRDITAMRKASAGGGAPPAPAGEGEGEGEHCPRGLEHMSSAAHMSQRKMRKEGVANAVLDVQDIQFEADVFDGEEEIRDASRRNSRWAREKARDMADSDSAYVRIHVRPEVDAYLRSLADGASISSAADQQAAGDSHLSVLQNALNLSDSDESVGSAGRSRGGKRSPKKKGSHLFSTATSSLQRKARHGCSKSTLPLAQPSVTMPHSAVDTILNRMSSRTAAGVEAKGGVSVASTRISLPAAAAAAAAAAQPAATCTLGNTAALNLQQGPCT